jgi:hypothetical protein
VKVDRYVLIAVAAIVVGGVAFQNLPAPNPKPERPVLKFIAKVAKLGLWLMFVHAPQTPRVFAAHSSQPEPGEQVHRVDESGQRILNHAEGW